MIWDGPIPRWVTRRSTSFLLLIGLVWQHRWCRGLAGLELLAMQCLESRLDLIAFSFQIRVLGKQLVVVCLQLSNMLLLLPLFRKDSECPPSGYAVHVRAEPLVRAIEICGNISVSQ
jgi:hypothetical protein